MHEHFDNDGTRTGYTVITRESEWDDESRGRALRLAEYEASICSCGCGLPMQVAHKEQPFKVTTFTCQAGRAIQQARREADENAKRSKKPEGWNDGLYYVAQPHEPEGGHA